MRILIISETWRPGVDGVVTRLEHTVAALAGHGHRVRVMAPTIGAPMDGVEQQVTPGLVVPIIDPHRRWGMPHPLLRREVDRFDPAVVHVVNPVLMGSLAAFSVAERYPLVASLHTDLAAYASAYRIGFTKPALKALTRRAYRKADVRLATSDFGLGLIHSLAAGPAEIWMPAVDTALFARPRTAPRRWNGEEINLLCVGRLAVEKDFEKLLDLMRGAATGHPRIRLTMVGDGPDRPRLERLFAGTPTRFTGLLRGDALVAAYESADVLAFTSQTDTVGLVLLEAAAGGLPVVAVDSPIVRDTLRGYDRLELVPSDRPTAAQWTSALLRAAGSGGRPLLRQERPVSWQDATEDLLGFYRMAVSRFERLRGGVAVR